MYIMTQSQLFKEAPQTRYVLILKAFLNYWVKFRAIHGESKGGEASQLYEWLHNNKSLLFQIVKPDSTSLIHNALQTEKHE